MELKNCDDCTHGKRLYCDGYVYRDWTGKYEGDPSKLPKIPDNKVYWTYQECAKNKKGLLHINLDGKCSAFSKKALP